MASWGSYTPLSNWHESMVDSRNRLALCFSLSALPKNSDWSSCSGRGNSRSSGQKPNFDAKHQKSRNDSSYQFSIEAFSPDVSEHVADSLAW